MGRDPISRNNVVLAGNPEAATTLLFAHGLGTDQSIWHRILPAFQDDYRLVSFDNVGAAKSNQEDFRKRQSHYLNMDGYASDLLEICSTLGLNENTVLVGHSMGALAGVIASIRRPWQFKRLALIGVSPRYINEEGYEGGFTRAEIDATYKVLLSNYPAWTKAVSEAAMATPDRPQLADQFAESMARVPPEMMLTVLCSVLQTDHRDDFAKIAVPTLLIQSRSDYFVPLSVAEYLREKIPSCQLKMIDATGHLPHVSAPEQVIQALSGFLATV